MCFCSCYAILYTTSIHLSSVLVCFINLFYINWIHKLRLTIIINLFCENIDISTIYPYSDCQNHVSLIPLSYNLPEKCASVSHQQHTAESDWAALRHESSACSCLGLCLCVRLKDLLCLLGGKEFGCGLDTVLNSRNACWCFSVQDCDSFLAVCLFVGC